MSNTPEQIAVQACKESARDNGIVGGSAYDCALRAATIALQSAADTPVPPPPQTHVMGLEERCRVLLKVVREIAGNGDGTGKNPQLMVNAAIEALRTIGELS